MKKNHHIKTYNNMIKTVWKPSMKVKDSNKNALVTKLQHKSVGLSVPPE